MENENVKETGLMIKDFNEMENVSSKSKTNVFTTITDNKTIFNLENTCDYKVNDCKGEVIRVKDVLIKVIETPMAEPEINEETGEVVRDTEYKKVCILIDDEGKSYVTGSKMFTNQMIRYINMFGIQDIEEGLEIRIVERAVKNSANKALGFELVK
ncbi:MAG: hypothetical protein IIT81_01740 [Mycoplasmataceae bacterium]|nr:hypothetical protein [Bacilli bacterium]MBQ5500916.1 hypothetical protein [Mycoplasmataceae bacterium]